MAHEIKFWDISKRLDWFRARALSRKILERPDVLGEISECIEKTWGNDPFNQRSLRIWRKLVVLSPLGFADFVLADNLEAVDARESYPPFFILTQEDRLEFLAQARREVAMAP